jgi:homoserine trans-succinylase
MSHKILTDILIDAQCLEEKANQGLWIARDERNHLALFNGKPEYKPGSWSKLKYWQSSHGRYIIDLPEDYFPEVTFENSPKRIILTLE